MVILALGRTDCWWFCALSALSTRCLILGRLFRTRSRGVVEVSWTWAWPSMPGTLPRAPGAACPTIAGDRNVVFDVDSTLISITEVVILATRCCIWAGPLFRNVQRPNPLFFLISVSKKNHFFVDFITKISNCFSRPFGPRRR